MTRQEIITVVCMLIWTILLGKQFVQSLKEDRPVFAALSIIMAIIDFAVAIFVLTGGMR